MDPNVTLDSLRRLMAELERVPDASADAGERWYAAKDALSETVDTWRDLDEWITRGGSYPTQWQH